jgi:hypothetical protein
VLCAPWL